MMKSNANNTQVLWARSADGAVAGVCSGFAKRFNLDVVLVRLILICSILIYGFGFGIYFIFAFSLPREDKLAKVYEPRILGVCSRFAQRFDIDVGLTRAAFLFLLISSVGLIFFVYLILHLILPKDIVVDGPSEE